MNRNIVGVLVAMALLPWIAGCAGFSPAVNPYAKIDPKMGYVYGRFWLEHTSGGVARLRMGLAMEAQGQAGNYTVQFEPTNVPTVVAVRPGTYVFTRFIYATWDYAKAGEKSVPPGAFSRPFTIEAGKAYYIADVAGRSSAITSGNVIRQSWRVDSVRDGFDKTTADVKTQYLYLRDLDFVRMFPANPSPPSPATDKPADKPADNPVDRPTDKSSGK